MLLGEFDFHTHWSNTTSAVHRTKHKLHIPYKQISLSETGTYNTKNSNNFTWNFFNNVNISWNIRKHYLLYFHMLEYINLNMQERELDNVCRSTSDLMAADPLRPSKCITKQNPNDTICWPVTPRIVPCWPVTPRIVPHWPVTPRIVPTAECHAAYMAFVAVYREFHPSGI